MLARESAELSEKLDKALSRLQNILPLKQRLDDCPLEVKALYLKILHAFVEQGRILSLAEMQQYAEDVQAAVTMLQEKDMVVFSAQGEPLGAYPFTMETREHRVTVNGRRVHAMCALDALAVSPMFGLETRIDSRCRATGDPVAIRQSGNTVLNPDEAGDVHFGIIWGAASNNSCVADSLCTEMVFLRDAEVARRWLADDPGNREIFALQEAIEFGDRFFSPLLS